MGHITVVAQNSSQMLNRLSPLQLDLSVIERLQMFSSDKSNANALVGVIMGSDSDLAKVKSGLEILRDFEIPFEVTIVSAHRTPERMVEYAKTAHKRGLKVIIAAAGGAAHLPGMVASLTPLPVIGIPVKVDPLDGIDSLMSIVQMPNGVPVATVAINNSSNAALLAARILAASDQIILKKIQLYQQNLANQVMKKVDKLANIGWENYNLQ